jgi:putative acetyltransferase
MIVIERSDPKEPQATALLQASHALMQSLFPPEDNSFLSIEELCAEEIFFFTARRGTQVLATGALVVKTGYGEIKSMFVDPSARGQGVGDAIVRALHDLAREKGLGSLKLETGNSLHAALRLYARHGFTPCGPFGDYIANDSSIFMTKTL